MTQGVTLEELQSNLKDIYQDLTGGTIPFPGHREINEILAKNIMKKLGN